MLHSCLTVLEPYAGTLPIRLRCEKQLEENEEEGKYIKLILIRIRPVKDVIALPVYIQHAKHNRQIWLL